MIPLSVSHSLCTSQIFPSSSKSNYCIKLFTGLPSTPPHFYKVESNALFFTPDFNKLISFLVIIGHGGGSPTCHSCDCHFWETCKYLVEAAGENFNVSISYRWGQKPEVLSLPYWSVACLQSFIKTRSQEFLFVHGSICGTVSLQMCLSLQISG